MKPPRNPRRSAILILFASIMVFVPGDIVSLPLPLQMIGTTPLQISGLTAIGLMICSIFSTKNYSRHLFFAGAVGLLIVHLIVIYRVFSLDAETACFVVASGIFLVVWVYVIVKAIKDQDQSSLYFPKA